MQYSLKRTKLFVVVILVVAMLLSMFNLNVNAASQTKPARTIEYVAHFKGIPKHSDVKDEIERYGGKLNSYQERIATFNISTEMANKMKNESTLVKNIEVNKKFSINRVKNPITLMSTPQKGFYQYSHELTNVKSAWNQGYTGKGIDIAVIDTGVNVQKDLNIVNGISFVTGIKSYADDEGHGTHVAGIIAGLNNGFGITGVAPESNIYAVKVLDKMGSGEYADIARGINWATRQKVDIINLSLGGDINSLIIKDAIENATNKGIFVVAASGNTGYRVEYPAKYNNVIAVGSINMDSELSWFSSNGPELDLVAPGEDIISTGYKGYFQKQSGTSQATPYVAGMIALYKQAFPTASYEQIKNLLYNHATDFGVAGRDDLSGYGLVQFPQSVTEVDKTKHEKEYVSIVREKAEKVLKDIIRKKMNERR